MSGFIMSRDQVAAALDYLSFVESIVEASERDHSRAEDAVGQVRSFLVGELYRLDVRAIQQYSKATGWRVTGVGRFGDRPVA